MLRVKAGRVVPANDRRVAANDGRVLSGVRRVRVLSGGATAQGGSAAHDSGAFQKVASRFRTSFGHTCRLSLRLNPIKVDRLMGFSLGSVI